MKILGLSAFYHDSAACLLDDGNIVCAVQEERFTRKKNDPSFPHHSIKFCLEKSAPHSSGAKEVSYNDLLKNIHCIAYYDKPFLTFERLLETYLTYAPFKGFSSFKEVMPLWLGGKLNIRSLIKKEFKKHLSIPKKGTPEILFNYHHLSHAASTFFPSPFKSAAILCLDGVGEWATTSAWTGEESHIEPLWQIDFPHSLGLFYSTFTEYCGFRVNEGEYKLMGLAPYGSPRFVSLLKENVIDIKPDGSFSLNLDYFDYPFRFRMAGSRLYKLLNRAPRKPEESIDIHYMDVACSAQKILEEVIFKLASTLYKQTKADNLCLAGGVALNCVANGKILDESPFSSLWIPPASGDAGGAVGAALSVWHQHFKKPRVVKKPDAMGGARLGPEYSSETIEQFLKKIGACYDTYTEEDLIEKVVAGLIQGKVTGWFQGALEFGPRALGCRSILGDARLEDMQKKINLKVKFRESFRPFAISILEEKVGDYFEKFRSPYMLLVSHIVPEKRRNEEINSQKKGLEKLSVVRSPLPAVTHVDYSTRIQTVGGEAHPRYRKLIEYFYRKTGCPGIINTSFNVRGEPIVRSPEEAWHCFMKTDMDILVLDCYLLKKEEQRKDSVELSGERLSTHPEKRPSS